MSGGRKCGNERFLARDHRQHRVRRDLIPDRDRRVSPTTPSNGAVRACSIFIASSTTIGWPLDTTSPAFAGVATILPGMGARSEPSDAAPPAAPGL
jgi:hypothetical protein